MNSNVLSPEDTDREEEARKVYAWSVVAGGLKDQASMRAAVSGDPVVRAHYDGLDPAKFQPRKLEKSRRAYVSYRIGSEIYWTRAAVLLAQGETVLTDGQCAIRGRCGNRISETPRYPVAPPQIEPNVAELDHGVAASELAAPRETQTPAGGWIPGSADSGRWGPGAVLSFTPGIVTPPDIAAVLDAARPGFVFPTAAMGLGSLDKPAPPSSDTVAISKPIFVVPLTSPIVFPGTTPPGGVIVVPGAPPVGGGLPAGEIPTSPNYNLPPPAQIVPPTIVLPPPAEWNPSPDFPPVDTPVVNVPAPPETPGNPSNPGNPQTPDTPLPPPSGDFPEIPPLTPEVPETATPEPGTRLLTVLGIGVMLLTFCRRK